MLSKWGIWGNASICVLSLIVVKHLEKQPHLAETYIPIPTDNLTLADIGFKRE